LKLKISAVFLLFLSASLLCARVNGEIIKDDVGRMVDVNTPVESIVCLSPADTEIIYWLGLQSRLVAVSLNCDYPHEAKTMEKAGSFLYPDVEKIAAYKPDVVISGGGIQKKAIAKLEKLKIPVLVLYPADIDKGLIRDMETIGGLAGDYGNVKKRILEYRRFLSEASAEKGFKPLKVYLEVWNQPVMSVGAKSFINDELKLAGGKNILSPARSEYPKITPEEVVKLNPDVIILLYKPEKDYKERAYFKLTKAGKNGDIYVLDNPDTVLRAGPRIPAGVKQLREILEKAAYK